MENLSYVFLFPGLIYRYLDRAGHLKWIVVLILEVIVLMFETTGGLVKWIFDHQQMAQTQMYLA